MELDYKPVATEKEDAKVTGTVKVRVPNVIEKFRYLKESGIQMNDLQGLNELSEEKKKAKLKDLEKSIDGFEKLLYYLGKLESHVAGVSLVRTSNKQKITTYDALISDPDCEAVALELAGKLMGGFAASGN